MSTYKNDGERLLDLYKGGVAEAQSRLAPHLAVEADRAVAELEAVIKECGTGTICFGVRTPDSGRASVALFIADLCVALRQRGLHAKPCIGSRTISVSVPL